MTACDREDLVLEVVRGGRDVADTELPPHLAVCQPCADLLLVATAIRDEHRRAMQEANVPTSGAAWWRIQRRSRADAVRVATHTITAVQAVTVGGAVAVALAIVGAAASDWRWWLKMLAARVEFDTALAQSAPALALLLMACLAIAPLAVYVTFARD